MALRSRLFPRMWSSSSRSGSSSISFFDNGCMADDADADAVVDVVAAPSLKVVQEWSRDQDSRDGGGNEDEDSAKYVAADLESADTGGAQ
jgi:hypothetical protein